MLSTLVVLYSLTAPFASGTPSLQADASSAQKWGPASESGGGTLGSILPKPDGSGFFIEDPNQGGEASELRLFELAWGRLVDVHGLEENGMMDPTPVFPQLVVSESLQSDGIDYVLETNPVTQVTRLIVQRLPGKEEPSPGAGTFEDLVLDALQRLPTVVPKSDDGSSSPPFSLVPRNAALTARFDDLLQDDEMAIATLADNVRMFVGLPPVVPFDVRVLFDENHGGIGTSDDQFHSTRVIVDLTLSPFEAASLPFAFPINQTGLPSSSFLSAQPNISLRIPSQTSFGSGQFTILTNLSGQGLSTTANGPVDLTVPTQDIVRAARSGNTSDINNGFLLDLSAPKVLGSFPVIVQQAQHDPRGQAGLDFLIEYSFSSSCRHIAEAGAVIEVGEYFLELKDRPSSPLMALRAGLPFRALNGPLDRQDLLGAGRLFAVWQPQSQTPRACWLTFQPAAGNPPSEGVDPNAQLLIGFTEPMDPVTLDPFDGLTVVSGPPSSLPTAYTQVPGSVSISEDLAAAVLTPLTSLSHVQGTSEVFTFRMDRTTDLAGNPHPNGFLPVEFRLAPQAPTQETGGVVLRFDSTDELMPGMADLRGQLFYDLDRGIVNGRPAARTSYAIDRTNPVPSLMVPLPFGTQTPLNPFGAKLQHVWRYADLGFLVSDETKYDIDIEGMAYAPLAGSVIADFYPEFEIALAHSGRLPDEQPAGTFLPQHPLSGLLEPPGLFADNILNDARNPLTVVHNRSLGYFIQPADLFVAPTGTIMIPLPWNRGSGPPMTYTWRNTEILAKGAPMGAGIPMDIEVSAGVEPMSGDVANPGEVPSIGLPLLIEVRCFPTSQALGLNLFDVSLAFFTGSLSAPRPVFRAWSEGGVNSMGQLVTINPDLEVIPSGGFNPFSIPPNLPSAPTNAQHYLGQLDTVIRVSHAYSAWIDTGSNSPDFAGSITALQEPGTSHVLVELRGAVSFIDNGLSPFDATSMDAYGDSDGFEASFLGNDPTWRSLDEIDGARYAQLRITFVNDIEVGLGPELDGYAFGFLP